MQTISVIGLPVAVTNYRNAITWILERAKKADRAYAVEAGNTHVAALARHDSAFGSAMRQFDLICPDGMPLLWSVNARLPAKKKLKDRVYGPTLMLETIKATDTTREMPYRHFFLGGKHNTLDRLKERFSKQFPRAVIAGMYSPPFGEWPEGELAVIIRKIKDSGANLIWLGLGCPKQEYWIAQHKDKLPPGVYFGVGAAFAFHAGEVKQAPHWIQRLGLEWMYRMFMEPRRLFKRYFVYNSLFVYYTFLDRMFKR